MGRGTGPLYPVDTIGGSGIPGGATDSEFCTFRGIVKKAETQSPFLVANEFIAGRLAMMLGLPVPPGAIVELDDGTKAYGCMRFGANGDAIAPAIASVFVADNPTLAAKIVMFDCWIANEDRHEGNLADVNHTTPMIYDHDQSLFGANGGRRLDRLDDLRDSAILNGCLAQHVTNAEPFSAFANRIRVLCHPLYGMVRSICEEVRMAGIITADEEGKIVEFLEYREPKLIEMVRKLPNLGGQGVLL